MKNHIWKCAFVLFLSMLEENVWMIFNNIWLLLIFYWFAKHCDIQIKCLFKYDKLLNGIPFYI